MRPSFSRQTAQTALFTNNFRKDQTGSMSILALFFFLLMVMMGGVAIDFMRYEEIRVRLQNTLDRCTLMAASLNQTLNAESVVRDCVAKDELTAQLAGVTVVQSAESRNVTAIGKTPTNPIFLHLVGIDELDAKAKSVAIQGVNSIELSLVLDVSGSMSGAKIASLRTTAAAFVGTVLAADPMKRVSVSLVPYNGQVNLGPNLRSKYTTTDNHGVANVNCIDLPSSVYDSTAMSTTLPMPMTGHVDSYSGTRKTLGYLAATDGWAVPYPLNRWCPPSTTNIVRPPSNNVTALQAQIAGLQAIGATSINAGLKWGLALLDPASRPMISSLVADGLVDVNFQGRPVNYGDKNTMKIVVLMTDGSHFEEDRLNAGYRTGPSPIWRSTNDQNYSIFHANRPGPNQFWVPHLGIWQAAAWNNGGGAVKQNWETVWANQRLAWVAWQMYGRAAGPNATAMENAYSAAVSAMRSKTPVVNMDAQLQQICTKAKDNNVLIYGIAFEAPLSGQAQISQCATTSKEHFFDASNEEEMRIAFEAIASNITQLKLTQ